MEQNTRERLRRWTITCAVLGGLALLAGVGLLLYGETALLHIPHGPGST